jgi:hypothetical protein
MTRQQLIDQIDALDQQLTLRTEVVNALAKSTHSTFKKVPPIWLIGSGVLAGTLAGYMGATNMYSAGIAGSRLFPMARHAFSMGRQFGAGE